MKVRKAIKKIAALGVGLSMLGTTVLGAMAADLKEYPNPLFIKDGEFKGVIILGDTAAASDTLGAIDIATGLQYSGGASSDVTISDGAKISASGNDLNINEAIYDVDAKLDNSDLPVILADGVFDESEGNTKNNEKYSQELAFSNTTGTLSLKQDDDDAKLGALYMFFGTSVGNYMYNYTLEFDDYAEYDNTSSTTASNDLETAKIDIQGNKYTITEVKLTSANKIKTLTLQAGDTTIWLEQGQPITRIVAGAEHEVELVDVNENENKCGITVDGTLQWVDKSSSKKIAGIEVGVTDAIVVHSETKDTDVCEVNLGATELTLENGKAVEINGVKVDGSQVLYKETTGGQIEKMSVWYVPEDKIYLAEGKSVADPVLGNIEFSFGAITAKTTPISIDVASDDLTVEFKNIDGKDVKLPFFCDGSCNGASDVVFFGTGADVEDMYYLDNGNCNGTSAVTECEGMRFLVEEGKELHVIELDDLDLADNKTTLKDVTYGGTKTTSNSIKGAYLAVELPSGGQDVQMKIDTSAAGGYQVAIKDGSNNVVGTQDTFYTQYEGLISLEGLANSSSTGGINSTKTGIAGAQATTNVTIWVNETDGEVDSTTDTEGDTRGTARFILFVDTSDEEFNINAPTISKTSTASAVDVSDANNDDKVYYTLYGTKIVYDSKDKRSAELTFPEEELYANVFVSPVGANVVVGGAGGATKKIEVGTAKLASEVASLSAQSSVIVGGPCANEKAAEFLGVTKATCMDGAPEANTAVIKLKAYGDYVAMLVNGYQAIDTRRASRVLANYADYKGKLAGDEVVVSGTDFTNIVVASAAK
jgi:hypothetical protein